MFDYEKLIRKLREFNKLSKSKQEGLIEDILTDKNFAEFLYKPKGIPNLATVVGDMYAGLSKPAVIKTIVRYVEDEGYEEFNRTHAAFLYNLCNLALETNNDREKERVEKKRSGTMSNKEFQETGDRIEEYAKLINRLFKCVKKINKKSANSLSEESNVSGAIVKAAMYSVPTPAMIDRFKIGRYLDVMLTNMYDKIEEKRINVDSANWRVFFKELFGKDNLAEVATFLLLEGHNRRDKYSCDEVIRCWDSLTEFALKQINDSPEMIRDHMMELYLKRVARMFTNGTYELRVDMLSIPKLSGYKYPNLTDTISKYLDKLEDVLKG